MKLNTDFEGESAPTNHNAAIASFSHPQRRGGCTLVQKAATRRNHIIDRRGKWYPGGTQLRC